MTLQRPILFIGGSDAGKSNYLFRIWLAVGSETTALKKNGLPTDLQYLSTGADALLRGAFAPHTSRDFSTVCTIPVLTEGIGVGATLVVPDASGERWLQLYRSRQWYKSWDDYITEDAVFILFVRPASEAIVPPMDWITSEKLYGHESNRQEQATGDDRTPTQVLLVDWLQIVRMQLDRRVERPTRPRLSVLISAWDALPEQESFRAPQAYLDRNFPLLGQYLAGDLHGFDARVFGVSVSSGDLNDPKFRDAYLESDPLSSGYVIAEGRAGRPTKTPDITLPVRWAMGA